MKKFLLAFLCIVSIGVQAQNEKAIENINYLVDEWHKAAAVADEEIYFNSFTGDAIFIGTDKTEHWTRPEFEKLYAPIFEKAKAWDFKPYERHVFFSEDNMTAWWDEMLETWMGPCRGSGVAVLTDTGWKISHYHLSVTIDNDKIDGFLELTGVPPRK